MQRSPKHTLNNGTAIDVLGYGVYKVPADDCAALVSTAIDAGYRTVDTASLYANEEGVGAAVRGAVAAGTPREELFVTSKVWNTEQGYDSTLAAFDASMEKLGLDYLDLYLIHWPAPARELYIPTYKALESLYRDGRVRAIGVSNFEPEHLHRLLDATDVVPAVNQVELHPWLAQVELRELHASLGIATQAWSPLARGAIFTDPVLASVAAAVGRSVAQVVLRWHVQSGHLVIPKASSATRIAENLDVFGFALSDAQMAEIDSLDRGQRSGSHPNEVN
ncbi:diketogulonate reductase-like aldo/keto reductase [Arthrobacter stackebrandtii]|uniref:Diketogulonate reductase-like aldo/keto reductase n=1 Tax=Arthrobacter stackebrandtii TaxID=272161 RepID=A0ABS4Z055_9MICC|nr:aldo/keto reductase [Arthrobacter stackebrandtii]MBP2414423.1 diketogulonate reductase-like aldo/keto reductase [Arthrobacter stackebrandtii]PYH01552.1 oxidoreductase [Arthrobacter stackebrandtii]